MTSLQSFKKVHFIGIGGYGMSALAFILLQQGFKVTGSDIKESDLTKALSKKGAEITFAHEVKNVEGAELIIYSTAIEEENVEFAAAKRQGTSLWHRSELLAALLNSAFGIAVAGAHGKTTTTAMLALLLEKAGLDPTAIIGGVLPAFGSNARLGKSRYLVAEADESDRSFIRYYPKLAIVTGMEADHLEHYNFDYNNLKEAYRTFLAHLKDKGIAVLYAGDKELLKLAKGLTGPVIFYSVEGDEAGEFSEEEKLKTREEEGEEKREEKDKEEGREKGATSAHRAAHSSLEASVKPFKEHYEARHLKLNANSSTFDLYYNQTLIAPNITVGAPGRHNISNATAALAAAAALKIDPAQCAAALLNFHGAGRRHEVLGEALGVVVVDDYAHHPTEIKAALAAAALSGRRVLCLFQPHRYSRTAAFFEEFARAFTDADRLYLHQVYPAGEVPLAGASASALAQRISALYPELALLQDDDILALEKAIIKEARPKDLIITMGAGDVTHAARRLLARLKEKEQA